jgi:transposase
MSGIKYVGMDVHQATTVVAVLNGQGKLVQRSIVETKAETLRDFVRGLSGTIRLTMEEGTQAAWLHDLLKPLVAEVLVCNARALGKPKGNKSDETDSERLARLLRMGELTAVYHGEHGTRTLKQLARTYGTLVDDCTMVMNRIKAIYRGLGIASEGKNIYREAERPAWLATLEEAGVRFRAETLFAQLEGLVALRKAAKAQLLKEARRHPAFRLLGTVPGLGPVRSAQLLAILDTPHRFRSKRELWADAGLAVVRHASSEYRIEGGRARRVEKAGVTRGLNLNGNRRVKEIFKGAANTACAREPFSAFYTRQITRGLKPAVARVALARKIASVALAVWKSGEGFDAKKLTEPTT